MPNFEEIAGVAVLMELFRINPRAKDVFGVPRDHEVTEDEVKTSPYLAHAYNLVNILDGALQLLGPDSESLREILHDLGKKHSAYGISAQLMPYMSHAILNVFKAALSKDVFTPEVEDAWVQVFDELNGEMMYAMLKEKTELRETEERELSYTTKKRSSIQSLASTETNTSISEGGESEVHRSDKRTELTHPINSSLKIPAAMFFQ